MNAMIFETTIPVLGVLLCLSEVLPLIKKIESNGILDMMIRLCKNLAPHTEDQAPLFTERSTPPAKYYDGTWRVRSGSPENDFEDDERLLG